MTKRRRKKDVQPRILSVAMTADYIGRCLTWFMEHRTELEANGFPEPIQLLDGYDRSAIDEWLDRQGGRGQEEPNTYDERWERAASG